MRLVSALMGTSMLFAAAPAMAQAPPSSGVRLEELIVTAQRRAETLQEVPVAVSALNEQAIERLNARDVRDLTGRIPNLVLSEVNIGPSMSQVSIRGVNSQDPEKSFDPAVGVFIDGVYLGTSAFNLIDAFDLERIEVLRGPQGTLFGRNTTGGALVAYRTEPTGRLGGKVAVTLGTDERRDLRGVFNTPLVGDVLALKLSGALYKDDGIYANKAGGSTGAKDRWNVSGSLKWTPIEAFEAVLTYDHAEDDSELTPYAPRGVATISPLPIRITQTTFPRPATVVAAFPPDLYCVTPGGRCEEAVSSITDPHRQNSELDALTLNLGYQLSPTLRLDAVFGWRESSEAVYIDFDGTDRTVFNVVRAQEYEQQSGEVRLASSFEGPLNFVAGVFSFHSKYSLQQAIKLDVRMTGAPVPLGAVFVNGSGDADWHSATTNAVFAQVDYAFTEELTLTVGGRATWDKKRIYTVFYGAPAGITNAFQVSQGVPQFRPATSFGGAEEDWFEFTPRVAVNWKPNEDLLVYASYSRGYNAGGFSARAGTVPDVTTPFDPEYIDAFEVGVKADLLDGRLRLNVAGFWNDYQDKQEEAIEPGPPPSFTSTTVRNVAGARIRGLEVEATAVLSDEFRLEASVGYMDAKYTEFMGFLSSAQYVSTPAQPAGTLLAADFSSLALRRTPEWTASLTPTYTAPVGPGTLTVTGTVRYTDEQFSEIFNSARGRIPAQTIVDASAAYEFGGETDDQFRITAFVKNLTEEVDFTSLTNSLVDFGVLSPPRTFGVEFQARF